jgi:hypothetical protein
VTESRSFQIMDALATQIRGNLAGTADPVIEGLQAEPLLNDNPTPPSIDVYPANPYQEPIGFGKGNNNLRFVVRARVGIAENQGGQKLLLSMMDPWADESVTLAILADRTLDGEVAHVHVEGPSDFAQFTGDGGDLLACTWTVVVTP